jgi:hypothetical protein
MRKFFMIIGVLAVITVVGGGIGLLVLARSGAALDTASKAYTEEAVVAIAANWEPDELWKRASPHLRKIATRDQISGLFNAAKRSLGPMLEYRGSQGQALIGIINSRQSISARYVATGNFQKGSASFKIALVKEGGTWMIEGFHIDSPVLMQQLVGIRS